jgi:hypothetical protein
LRCCIFIRSNFATPGNRDARRAIGFNGNHPTGRPDKDSKSEPAEENVMAEAKKITDHEEIRRWVEERGGHPARVKATAEHGGGILRIDFRQPDQGLEEISWEEFFEVFDKNHLALLEQERTEDGGLSRFAKFVDR